MVNTLKSILTRIGVLLSPRVLLQIQASVNYMRIGLWMRERGFSFPRRVRSREKVWAAIVDRVKEKKVLYLEFGVAYGASMSYWSRELKCPDTVLHGFDSFEGLPEGSGPWAKGQFDAQGRTPVISDNRVRFFKGWFDQVLPTYSVKDSEVLVINMDADLYSSTIYVLRYLEPYIKPGSFIYFDEMNHIDHEPRAFDEFMRESGITFRPFCADKTLAFVAFECTGRA